MNAATELVASIDAQYGPNSDAANAVRQALTLSRRRKRASTPIETLDAALQTAVAGQRKIGRSWAHIGAATGMTRQSAFERWGRNE